MAVLTRSKILEEITAGRIVIEPFEATHVGDNSVDLRLGDQLLYYTDSILDMKKEPTTEILTIPPEGFLLEPYRLYLGHTLEYTKTPYHVPWVDGRSSIGRLGLIIHVTAGRGDVGFEGDWTLELVNLNNVPLRIYSGIRICQITYMTVSGHVSRYQGKYQGQKGPRASRLWQDFQEK